MRRGSRDSDCRRALCAIPGEGFQRRRDLRFGLLSLADEFVLTPAWESSVRSKYLIQILVSRQPNISLR